MKARLPGYKEALDLTARTVNVRARAYLALVIGVVVIAAGSTLWAIAAWSWRPLVGHVLLVVVCAAFVSFDAWVVARWRHRILRSWVDDLLDLETFRKLVTGTRALPTQTVASMLEPFRVPASTTARSNANLGTLREAIAQALRSIDVWQASVSTSTTAGLIPVATGAIAAAAMHSWTPLAVAAFALPVAWTGRLVAARQLRRSIPRFHELRIDRASADEFALATAGLDWGRLPSGERDRMFAALSGGEVIE